MICILIKCSASLFNHTVQYASAPVALKLHPSCCYKTVLEVSADHITSPSCSSSLSHSHTHTHKKRYCLCYIICHISQDFRNTEYTPCLYIKKPYFNCLTVILWIEGIGLFFYLFIWSLMEPSGRYSVRDCSVMSMPQVSQPRQRAQWQTWHFTYILGQQAFSCYTEERELLSLDYIKTTVQCILLFSTISLFHEIGKYCLCYGDILK